MDKIIYFYKEFFIIEITFLLLITIFSIYYTVVLNKIDKCVLKEVKDLKCEIDFDYVYKNNKVYNVRNNGK